MIEVARVIEHQSFLYSYRATENEEQALQLELLIEATKPDPIFQEWHSLIATPFRYPPPHPKARFRPLYGKNVFYASLLEETALYEHSFHFMKERLHLKLKTDTDSRTIFFVDANATECVKVKNHRDYSAITDKNDYTASHEFIAENPNISFILYPSCRDPQHRDNAAILDIKHLQKNPKWQSTINYFYDYKKQQLTWIDYSLHIQWDQVR